MPTTSPHVSDGASGQTNANRPLLTIAIPVFNREAELGPMLASLDLQDWGAIEVRYGDDGSTDGTPGVLSAFAERHPGRVFVDRHGNMGPGPSRNRLLEQAAGEWIWFCDSDDELAPGAVARIAGILRRAPCDILSFVYGHGPCPDDAAQCRLDAPDVAVTPSQLALSLLGATVAKVLRTDMLRAGGVSFPPLRAGEDWVFTARAACRCRSGRAWSGVPYWARNGFWDKSAGRHLTGRVDDALCEAFSAAFSELLSIRDLHPDLRLELGVMAWNLAAHLRNQIREGAPEEVRGKWLPVAEGFLREMAEARDNPLLRFPGMVTTLGSRILEIEAERDRAIARERVLRDSLSWRVTAPIRAIANALSRNGRK